MTTLTAPTTITPEQLERIPDNQSMELVDGVIVEKEGSTISSQFEASILFALQQFDASRRLAAIFSASLGYRCFGDAPDRIRKPDVSVIRIERFKALTDPNPGYMPIIPDLAVEVISTNDTVTDVDEKILEYRAAGFPLIWVVDPVVRQVTVYPNPGKPYLLTEEDEIRCENALPGFVSKVGDLFPPAI
ncbi:MAG: Uma2 family endonuclease [Phycisphaerae bacterium]|nr:Uma2 family endonuclease [Phycisphaerae bacterium]